LEGEQQKQKIVGVLAIKGVWPSIDSLQSHGNRFGCGSPLQGRAIKFSDIVAASTCGPVGAVSDFVMFEVVAGNVLESFRVTSTGTTSNEPLGKLKNPRVVAFDVVSEFVNGGGNVNDTGLKVD
jgi:hypothetical protein